MSQDREKTIETLVAWYDGAHSSAFADWLADLRERCQQLLGERFQPYPERQIHATLVDLSQNADGTNRAFRELRGESRVSDLAALGSWLEARLCKPLRIRFGAYRAPDTRLLSHGQRRWKRSFSIQGQMLVLIGWSDSVGELGKLRQGCEDFSVLHRYHAEADAEPDDDCYLRLGLLTDAEGLGDRQRAQIEDELRRHLARASSRIVVELGVPQLRVVRAQLASLALDSSQSRPLSQIAQS